MPRKSFGQARQRRPFLASFFTPTKSSPASRLAGSATRFSGRQQRLQRQAAVAGPRSFLGELAGSRAGTGDFVRGERRRQRRLVRAQYQREVRRLAESRKRADRELDKQLARRERTIAQQRGLYHYDPDNPQQARAKEFADRRFHTVERQQRGRHVKQWDEAERELERGRDQQYRLISKQLRQEQRQSLGSQSVLGGASLGAVFRLGSRAGGSGAGTSGGGLPPWRRDPDRGRDWRVGEAAEPAGRDLSPTSTDGDDAAGV